MLLLLLGTGITGSSKIILTMDGRQNSPMEVLAAAACAVTLVRQGACR
jgi:hypothetical protein